MTADQYYKVARIVVAAASQTQDREEFRRITAMLLLTSLSMMQKRYHLSPAASVECVEWAMQDAIEMFNDLEGHF